MSQADWAYSNFYIDQWKTDITGFDCFVLNCQLKTRVVFKLRNKKKDFFFFTITAFHKQNDKLLNYHSRM